MIESVEPKLLDGAVLVGLRDVSCKQTHLFSTHTFSRGARRFEKQHGTNQRKNVYV